MRRQPRLHSNSRDLAVTAVGGFGGAVQVRVAVVAAHARTRTATDVTTQVALVMTTDGTQSATQAAVVIRHTTSP